MKRLISLAALALLAACGGGGGSSSPLPVVSPPTVNSAPVLRASFSGHSAAIAARAGQVVTMTTTPKSGPVLSGQIVPLDEFVRQDSYIQGAFASDASGQALAILDTTGGGTISVPLPSVTWSQTGNPVPLDSPSPGPVPSATPPGLYLLSSTTVHTPTTLGATTIGISALSQNANLSVYTYPGSGLQTGGTHGTVGLPTALMFSSLGGAIADSQVDTDVYVDTSVLPNQLVFPYGAKVEPNSLLSAVTSVDSSIPTTSVRVDLTPTNVQANPNMEFRTHSAGVVKFRITLLATQVADGSTDYVYGGYYFTNSSTFAL